MKKYEIIGNEMKQHEKRKKFKIIRNSKKWYEIIRNNMKNVKLINTRIYEILKMKQYEIIRSNTK